MTRPEHVLWITGASGTGKSSLARRLAKRHGLRWYSCDTRTWEHRDHELARGNPAAREWEHLTAEQRLARTPDQRYRTDLVAERGSWVAADVAALPDQPAVIAEGTLITPAHASGGPGPRSPLLVIDSTDHDRVTRITERGWGEIAASEHQAAEHRRRPDAPDILVLVNDGTLDELIARVEQRIAHWIAAVPRAATADVRRDLIRDSNDAIIEQHRAAVGRAIGATSIEVLRVLLDCECARPDCTELIMIGLAEINPGDRPLLLAPGHPG